MTRLHAVAAFVVCIALPGLSWLDGSGSLAWTMFASSASFRLRIETVTATRRAVFNPTALAPHMVPSAGVVVAGSDHFRHATSARLLRASLPELAQLACRVSGANDIGITLEWKRRVDAPTEREVSNTSCRLR